MRDFLRASLKIAIAIFLALLGITVVVIGFSLAKDSYDRAKAKPFEEMRVWNSELKSPLGIEVQVKTKLVSSSFLASIEVVGYPKYLADPRNSNRSLIFEFSDKDGFKLLSKSVQISEFTTVVDQNGKAGGLHFQFDEYFGLEKYQRISNMKVGWNVLTELAPPASMAKPTLDHCAPNISRQERLERLAQYGPVREEGSNSFSASGRYVAFFYDGRVMNCR